MGFCTSCGAASTEGTRFCASCGKPAAGGGLSSYSAVPLEPLDYTIQGDNLQVARVRLKPGQEIYAEAGKMVYKTPNVEWETRMSGGTLGEKLWGALKRTVTGESLFLTYFRSNGNGEVGFAGNYPGRIQAFSLGAGQSVMAQRHAFLFAQTTVQLNVALVKKLGAGLLGGEGFVLEKLTGPGQVFIHGGGDFVEFELQAGEGLQVDTGCIVAFDESVDYDIQYVGGIKTALFGGEGLFLATLTGPGKVIVQSMTLDKLRRELIPMRTGGDERSGPLGAIGGILDSDD
ncbi:MAG: TIGR00266 family protein [Bryobacterales bacterium]|nr:TIGR00266 family protein [Bryobacterales bacterium]